MVPFEDLLHEDHQQARELESGAAWQVATECSH